MTPMDSLELEAHELWMQIQGLNPSLDVDLRKVTNPFVKHAVLLARAARKQLELQWRQKGREINELGRSHPEWKWR